MPDEGTDDVPKHLRDIPASGVYILAHVMSVLIASESDVVFLQLRVAIFFDWRHPVVLLFNSV